MDEALLPLLKKQYEKCDGHAIFSDHDAPGPKGEVLTVAVPEQSCNKQGCFRRNQSEWLFHKNMAGLIPAWNYLLEHNMLEKYDWIVNSELDHHMRPSVIRSGIETYMNVAWMGDEEARTSIGGAMMLMFGNVFLFNTEMVKEMKRQWPKLKKQVQPGSPVSGCPDWYDPPRIDCSQDEIYVLMAKGIMQPPVFTIGESGCGKPMFNSKKEPILPRGLACWNMDQSPAGGNTEADQLKTIREIAAAKGPFVPASMMQMEQAAVGTSLVELGGKSNGTAAMGYPIAYPDFAIPDRKSVV